MKFIQVLALASAFAATVTTTISQTNQVKIARDGRPERVFRPMHGLDHVDLVFLKHAAATNDFEILLGQMALDNGSSHFVKEFGKEMVEDHRFLKAEEAQTAQKKDAYFAAALPQNLERTLHFMQKLQGSKFDAAFERVEKSGHEQASKLYKWEIENGRDADVKAMAVKELPTIILHYRLELSKETMMGRTVTGHGN